MRHEVLCLLEVGVCLPRETADDVCRDLDARHGLKQRVRAPPELGGRVLAVHRGQHRVGAGLDRQVEVGEDAGVAQRGGDGGEVLEDEGRVRHADAQPHAAVRRELRDEQVEKRGKVCIHGVHAYT